MGLFEKIREISSRVARQRKILDEISALSDAELNDLNLSYAQVVALSRQQSYAN